jgi:hypothetical protein
LATYVLVLGDGLVRTNICSVWEVVQQICSFDHFSEKDSGILEYYFRMLIDLKHFYSGFDRFLDVVLAPDFL